MANTLKYDVKFDFTRDRKEDLREGVYTEEAGKRLIKSELDMIPSVDNGDGDVRYSTNDPVKALELLKLAFTISAGGWWCHNPMPSGPGDVFHLPMRGHKYANQPD